MASGGSAASGRPSQEWGSQCLPRPPAAAREELAGPGKKEGARIPPLALPLSVLIGRSGSGEPGASPARP